jgi:putative oxidoreductase
VRDVIELAGRLLIALLFLAGALQKFADPGPVEAMLSAAGLPPALVGPVALFNLAAALALALGPRVQVVAGVLAVYCIATSWFHWQLRADPWQVTIVVKNWAIAGGLLVLAAQGPGRWVRWR